MLWTGTENMTEQKRHLVTQTSTTHSAHISKCSRFRSQRGQKPHIALFDGIEKSSEKEKAKKKSIKTVLQGEAEKQDSRNHHQKSALY